MHQMAAVPSSSELDRFDDEARRQQFRWAADQVRRQTNPSTWQAFWLSAVDGHSGEWVAQQLGMSVGAVYVARCRTLAKIKRLLAPYREVNE
jgi:RNA polymerase sigma-70 factor (ECF subfamily)